MIRTEEWTKDYEGMITTVVVGVYDGEQVHPAVVGDHVRVAPDIAQEFGLPEGVEDADGFQQKFFRWHPYSDVAGVLTEAGWTRAST